MTKIESCFLLSKLRATERLATPFPENIGSMISVVIKQNRIALKPGANLCPVLPSVPSADSDVPHCWVLEGLKNIGA